MSPDAKALHALAALAHRSAAAATRTWLGAEAAFFTEPDKGNQYIRPLSDIQGEAAGVARKLSLAALEASPIRGLKSKVWRATSLSEPSDYAEERHLECAKLHEAAAK